MIASWLKCICGSNKVCVLCIILTCLAVSAVLGLVVGYIVGRKS